MLSGRVCLLVGAALCLLTSYVLSSSDRSPPRTEGSAQLPASPAQPRLPFAPIASPRSHAGQHQRLNALASPFRPTVSNQPDRAILINQQIEHAARSLLQQVASGQPRPSRPSGPSMRSRLSLSPLLPVSRLAETSTSISSGSQREAQSQPAPNQRFGMLNREPFLTPEEFRDYPKIESLLAEGKPAISSYMDNIGINVFGPEEIEQFSIPIHGVRASLAPDARITYLKTKYLSCLDWFKWKRFTGPQSSDVELCTEYMSSLTNDYLASIGLVGRTIQHLLNLVNEFLLIHGQPGIKELTQIQANPYRVELKQLNDQLTSYFSRGKSQVKINVFDDHTNKLGIVDQVEMKSVEEAFKFGQGVCVYLEMHPLDHIGYVFGELWSDALSPTSPSWGQIWFSRPIRRKLVESLHQPDNGRYSTLLLVYILQILCKGYKEQHNLSSQAKQPSASKLPDTGPPVGETVQLAQQIGLLTNNLSKPKVGGSWRLCGFEELEQVRAVYSELNKLNTADPGLAKSLHRQLNVASNLYISRCLENFELDLPGELMDPKNVQNSYSLMRRIEARLCKIVPDLSDQQGTRMHDLLDTRHPRRIMYERAFLTPNNRKPSDDLEQVQGLMNGSGVCSFYVDDRVYNRANSRKKLAFEFLDALFQIPNYKLTSRGPLIRYYSLWHLCNLNLLISVTMPSKY